MCLTIAYWPTLSPSSLARSPKKAGISWGAFSARGQVGSSEHQSQVNKRVIDFGGHPCFPPPPSIATHRKLSKGFVSTQKTMRQSLISLPTAFPFRRWRKEWTRSSRRRRIRFKICSTAEGVDLLAPLRTITCLSRGFNFFWEQISSY